jgi:hypothetical protein
VVIVDCEGRGLRDVRSWRDGVGEEKNDEARWFRKRKSGRQVGIHAARMPTEHSAVEMVKMGT